jgi:orotidine-5'-phosphate decarboxylase
VAANSRTLSPAERLAFPLDVSTLDAARTLVASLTGDITLFKVGLELYTAAGPDAVRVVHDAGASCFLDLKLHDIPATVSHAVRSAARLGVRYLTVHAAAGATALMAARDAAADDVRLLAVTVLTSLTDAALPPIGIDRPLSEVALLRARLAHDAGVHGLVCSPHECGPFRRALGDDPLLVVPGIRPEGSAPDDQMRTATPSTALAAGADILVVGRPIRHASDPRAAARAIVTSIAESAAAHR